MRQRGQWLGPEDHWETTSLETHSLKTHSPDPKSNALRKGEFEGGGGGRGSDGEKVGAHNKGVCVAVRCSVLQCAAVCCSVLQCVAVCCSVLPCVVVCCSVLQCAAVCCSALQCVAVCCNVLQCVAVCCRYVAARNGGVCVQMCCFM